MTFTAASLRELHRIHRQLSDLRERLDRGPKQIKARQANAAAAEEKLAKTHADSKAARVAIDQKQLLLRSGEAKIFELKNKLNTCHTNREYQALRDQILADEMANSVLSDEILEAMERSDLFKHSIAEAEQQVAKAKEESGQGAAIRAVARRNLAGRGGAAGKGTARSGNRIARRFPRSLSADRQGSWRRRDGPGRRGKLRRMPQAAYAQRHEPIDDGDGRVLQDLRPAALSAGRSHADEEGLALSHPNLGIDRRRRGSFSSHMRRLKPPLP